MGSYVLTNLGVCTCISLSFLAFSIPMPRVSCCPYVHHFQRSSSPNQNFYIEKGKESNGYLGYMTKVASKVIYCQIRSHAFILGMLLLNGRKSLQMINGTKYLFL